MIEGFLGKLLVGDKHPAKIIGVVNLSEASFYLGSIVSSSDDLEKKVTNMIDEGVHGIDLGAQSTRPIQIYGGEGRVDEITELQIIKETLEVTIDVLSSYNNIEISVDTQRSAVAEHSLNKGVNIINDISGFKKEEKIAKYIADFDGTAVVMAARTEPGDVYLINDIITELRKSIAIGIKYGIDETKIVIDPGIGSWEARDYHHDYVIIKNLEELRILNKPVYVGISRKTSIGKVLNDAPPDQRLFGTLGATIIALVNGAHIIRTHDVRPTLEAVKVAQTILHYEI